MKLNEPARACEAYKEFDAVYGAKANADLKTKVLAAKREAKARLAEVQREEKEVRGEKERETERERNWCGCRRSSSRQRR